MAKGLINVGIFFATIIWTFFRRRAALIVFRSNLTAEFIDAETHPWKALSAKEIAVGATFRLEGIKIESGLGAFAVHLYPGKTFGVLHRKVFDSITFRIGAILFADGIRIELNLTKVTVGPATGADFSVNVNFAGTPVKFFTLLDSLHLGLARPLERLPVNFDIVARKELHVLHVGQGVVGDFHRLCVHAETRFGLVHQLYALNRIVVAIGKTTECSVTTKEALELKTFIANSHVRDKRF